MYTRNIFPLYGGARLVGHIGEVALIAGAINSTPPLCRILWVLSWRHKKVPPPAGTGSGIIESVKICEINPLEKTEGGCDYSSISTVKAFLSEEPK